MIKIKGLHRDWKEFALKGIDLEVQDGEYFVILGPTGAGKTLLLELIAGFHAPDCGEIFINEKNVTGLPPEKRNIGFVYQDYSLFPHLDVRKNIEFGLRMRGIRDGSRVERMAENLNISHLLHRYPLTLSGGEQQRVALARVLLIEPDVLLLDEPLSALDPGTQDSTRRLLKKIHNMSDLMVIHVTHNQTEAQILADRIAVMMDGRIVQVAAANDVFDRPLNDRIAHFMGVENVLKGTVTSNSDGLTSIALDSCEIEAVSGCAVGEEVHACLRPENVTISLVPVKSSARNAFEGVVIEIEPMGALLRVKVDCGFGVHALITKQSALELGLETGRRVTASFKATAVHVV